MPSWPGRGSLVGNTYLEAIILPPSILISILASTVLHRKSSYVVTTLSTMLAPYMPHIPLITLTLSDPVEIEITREMNSRRTGIEVGQIIGYISRRLTTYSKLKLIGLESSFTRLTERVTYKIEMENPKHILVVGMTGYGKSSTAAKLAANAINSYKHVKILIIDPHGEYANLISRYLQDEEKIYIIDAFKAPLNPLDNLGLNPLERISEIVTLMRKLFRLGPIQAEILMNALREVYEVKGIRIEDPSTWQNNPPTIADLIKVLRSYIKVEERAITVLNHVMTLWNPALYSKTTNLYPLLTDQRYNIIIIDLHGIPTKSQQSLYRD
jgi:hypothetical protein